MNIQTHESRSSKLDNFITNFVMDRIRWYTNEDLGEDIEDILLSEKSKKYECEILKILDKYNYSFYSFYSDCLTELALKPLLDEDSLSRGILIGDVTRSGNEIIMSTLHGTYSCTMLAEEMNNSRLLSRKYDNDLLGSCHELTMDMTKKQKMDAETVFLRCGFCEDIIHSYNVGEDGMVYDTSHNLIIGYDDYQKLFVPFMLNRVTYSELLKSQEYLEFKKGKSTIYPLYSLAKKRVKFSPKSKIIKKV